MDPEYPERAMRMAEADTSDRAALMRQVVGDDSRRAATGQWAAMAITGVAMALSVMFFLLGNTVAGIAFVSMPLVLVVRAFLVDSR